MTPTATGNLAGSVIMFVAGAILRFAVAAQVDNVSLQTIGMILMIAGAVWFVAALLIGLTRGERDDIVIEERGVRRGY